MKRGVKWVLVAGAIMLALLVAGLWTGAHCELRQQPWQDLCYIKVAELRPSLNVCERVVDNGYRETCVITIALARSDSALCEKYLLPPTQYSCYAILAREHSDSDLCAQIGDPERVLQCRAEVQDALIAQVA